jgi:hypothetical protein
MQVSIPCEVNETEARLLFADFVAQMRYFFGDVAACSPCGSGFRVWAPNPYLQPPVREVSIEAEQGRVVLSSRHETCAADPACVALLTQELEQLVSFPVRRAERRVFGIGWQKTGTVSLALALRSLGYLTCHFAPWIIGHHHHSDPAVARVDLDRIEPYDAVLDIPAAALYRELDRRFPNSLFILTTRETEAWLDSAEIHMTRTKRGLGKLASVDRWAYGCDDWDPELFRSRYERHNRDVLAYFSGRPGFFCLDVTIAHPWQPLCNLLGVPIPSRPFPHLNRRPAW